MEKRGPIERHGWLAACGAVFATAFSAAGCQTIQEEVLIEARPATVWAILADAPRYAEWNPVHVRIEGAFREGAEITVHLQEPGGKITPVEATVRRMVPERELNQGGGVPLLLTFNHTFRLEPAAGGTRVTQREEFRGLGVLFTDLAWIPDGYRRVNAALKQRAEALERGR